MVPHNLPPQKCSQIRVKCREDKVHEEEAIQFLSYEALPALKTAEIKTSPKISSERAKVACTDHNRPAQCGLRTITATSLKQMFVNL